MNRIWGHLLTGTLTAACLGAFIAACAHDDSTVFIRGVLAPPVTGAQNGVCTYLADPTAPELSSGTLDIALAQSYQGNILVGNQMSPKAASDQTRTETSRVSLQGAIVHVTDASGAEINSFTSLGTGSVDPALSGLPGYGYVAAVLLDSKTADILRGSLPAAGSKTVVARFKIFGQTLGGLDVETNEFQYPISVCNGCLVKFPADSVDLALAQATGKPNCAAPLAAGAAGGACYIGQDVATDCRLCQGLPACDPATRTP